MKKVRVLTGLTAMVPVAAAAMTPMAAHAASDHAATDHTGTQSGKTVSFDSRFRAAAPAEPATAKWAKIIHGPAPWTDHDGSPDGEVKTGASVHVTCYYSGAPFASDTYFDHVNQVASGGLVHSVNGHVSDVYVNFGGKFPKSVGIGHC